MIKEQIIIIGNGFDIACGLKSKVDDFFRYYYGNDYEIICNNEMNVHERINYFYTKTNNIINNVWFSYFMMLGPQLNWTNIEKNLKNGINTINENGFKNILYSTNSNIGLAIKYKILKVNKIEWQDTDTTSFMYPRELFKNEDQIIQILIKDLNELENAFNDYLYEKSREKEYLFKSKKLFEHLMFSDAEELRKYFFMKHPIESQWGMKSMRFRVQILSFNYTMSLIHSFVKGYINVHGRLYDNKNDDNRNNRSIIFGVDDSLFVNQDGSDDKIKLGRYPLNIFSKSYRMIKLRNSGIDISNPIEEIKIYGHGLGEADYSYYQTIFDAVDLYNSNCCIIYYYSLTNKEQTIEQREEEVVSSLYKLIKTYGVSFENKTHGNNLFHKLLLEGRLRTEFLDTRNLFG